MKNYPVINPKTGKEDWVSRSVAVAVSIYSFADGKLCILANKRGKGLPNHVGKWNVVSGYIDYGETLLDACIREVHEETGVNISHVNLKLMEIDDRPTRENQTILFRYSGLLSDKQRSNSFFTTEYSEKDEVEDIKWIPVEDVDQYEWTSENHKMKIKEYAKIYASKMRLSEERAHEAFKERIKTNSKGTGSYDANIPRRKAYAAGYEQAASDILSWLEDTIDDYDLVNILNSGLPGFKLDGRCLINDLKEFIENGTQE